MFKNGKKVLFYFIGAVFTLVISGCSGAVTNMQIVPPEKVVSSPEKGKAMVVFMRPSSFGFAIQSSVFEIKDKKPELVGIVAAKKKVSYQIEPGKHIFMTVGENADFMYAEVEANKTYYALVTARMGMWKARFSLNPVSSHDLNTPKFMEWQKDTQWVEKNADSQKWSMNNLNSIQSKYEEYYADWMAKDISMRPKLSIEDGK